MPATLSEGHAEETLAYLGFLAEKIPEGKTKSADFIVRRDGLAYLVEVTEKEADEDYRDFLSEVEASGMATLARPMERSDRLERTLREKVKQLDATPIPSDFKLVWLAARHGDAVRTREVLLLTLYGMERLCTARTQADVATPQTRECFYYHYFPFYRLPQLDGVVFATPANVALLLNPVSCRREEFRASGLFQAFAARDAIFDPENFAHTADAMVLGKEVDRSQPKEKWKYLRERYGVYTWPWFESTFEGLVEIK